ncbi:hypothetical protein [Paenibacillus aestuarii]|uniref:Uncharacterized protein n=1 Tax=Paenibacillus aestuarii TaxID=516965 RepID=A0ABW0K857_9BACL|nr:hypothetical protein [Paenibacillus aestuarii]
MWSTIIFPKHSQQLWYDGHYYRTKFAYPLLRHIETDSSIEEAYPINMKKGFELVKLPEACERYPAILLKKKA